MKNCLSVRTNFLIRGRLSTLRTKKEIELQTGTTRYESIPVTSTRSSDGLPSIAVNGALSVSRFGWSAARKMKSSTHTRDPEYSDGSIMGGLPVNCLTHGCSISCARELLIIQDRIVDPNTDIKGYRSEG